MRRMDRPRRPTRRKVGAGDDNEEDGRAKAAVTRMVGEGNNNKEDGRLRHGRHGTRTYS